MDGTATDDRTPLVSVVMPMHNAALRIEPTVQSVLRQTYPRLELVLVDDGSTDGTARAAVRSLNACAVPWRIIKTPNRGPSGARNTGWRAAQGRLIQFLDDDDELHPDKIAVQVERLAGAGPSVAIAYSTWAVRAFDGASAGTMHYPRDAEWRLHDVIRADGFIHLGSALLSRSWLAAVGGLNEGLWLIEDVDLHIRLLAAGAAFAEAASSAPLFFHKRRPGSLSQSNAVAFADACLRNARLVYALCTQRDALQPAAITAISDAYRQAITAYAQADRSRFEAAYAEFRSLFPGHILQTAGKARYVAGVLGDRRAELLRAAVRRSRALAKGMLPGLTRA